MKHHLSLILLGYFRFLAKLQLLKNRPLIIGITGSAGKTTLLHAIAAVVQTKYTVKVSEKANSQSGLSLNILGLHPTSFSVWDWLRLTAAAPCALLFNWEKFQVYVAEMGIDSPDEPSNMEYLLKIIRPTIGVFSSVTLVHAEAFDHLVTERDVKRRALALKRAIAREKAKLITRLPATGTGVINSDYPLILEACSGAQAPLISFGEGPHAQIRLIEASWSDQGSSFTLKQGKTEAVVVQRGYLLPRHYGLSFAGAAGVGVALGISLSEAAAALSQHFILPPGRATLIPAINHATILDSSYNSAPEPLLDFFSLLAERPTAGSGQAGKGRTLALLGDMRELGKLSGYEHTRIAKRAAEVLAAVYLVGPLMRQYALPVFKKQHVPAFWFASAVAAAAQLRNDLRKDDLLLVKGSQNTLLLESAIEELMADRTAADQLLCRRGAYWNRQRRQLASQHQSIVTNQPSH